MFNKTKLRKVSDLTREICEKDDRIKELEADVAEKEAEINRLSQTLCDYTALRDATPDDCKRGEWCKACEFVKEFRVRCGPWRTHTIWACGKGESCPNFVQKEV